MVNTDKLIRELFGIYRGYRLEEEDDELYLAIWKQVYEEIFRFLEENLDLSRMTMLIREINMIGRGFKQEDKRREAIMNAVFNYLATVPHVRFRLERRIEHFLNNMVINSVKMTKKYERS